jgi:hypothetical protein
MGLCGECRTRIGCNRYVFAAAADRTIFSGGRLFLWKILAPAAQMAASAPGFWAADPQLEPTRRNFTARKASCKPVDCGDVWPVIGAWVFQPGYRNSDPRPYWGFDLYLDPSGPLITERLKESDKAHQVVRDPYR